MQFLAYCVHNFLKRQVGAPLSKVASHIGTKSCEKDWAERRVHLLAAGRAEAADPKASRTSTAEEYLPIGALI